MDKLYVVVDEYRNPLHWDSAPWDDGECLIHSVRRHFTVFQNQKEAQRALRLSREYSKTYDLEETWQTKEWKVITLEEVLNGLRKVSGNNGKG